jgi:hypothetical protein
VLEKAWGCRILVSARVYVRSHCQVIREDTTCTISTNANTAEMMNYLNPDVLIDSTSWRWKMKKSTIVGSATTVDAAMM